MQTPTRLETDGAGPLRTGRVHLAASRICLRPPMEEVPLVVGD